jgi:hypothetical protein
MEDVVVWPSQAQADSRGLGTRFLVFPQPPFVAGYERPEVVWISTPRGSVRSGPEDHRLYVIDPVIAKDPYLYPYLPPYDGALKAPVAPGPDGHFDHLAPGTREFLSAHAFACVRRVLDICESYCGREIPWFFSPAYRRLEIVPHLKWENAQSGYGFLEMGEDDSRGEPFPFALNFDAVAHETGHIVLFGTLGLPQENLTADFLAYHEAVADFVSLLALLNFDTALDRILRRTKGNLHIANELDRLAEPADERSVRSASHSLRLSDVGAEVHDRSKPFTGALFDTLLEIYQLILVERGLSDLDPRGLNVLRSDLSQSDIERELSVSRSDYERRHFAAKSALIEARDLVGETLAASWDDLSADDLTYRAAAEALVQAAEERRARRFADSFHANFAWRQLL